jgi:hypothetical protein
MKYNDAKDFIGYTYSWFIIGLQSGEEPAIRQFSTGKIPGPPQAQLTFANQKAKR